MARYAVTIFTPARYYHAEGFAEVAETVHHGLQALGEDSVLIRSDLTQFDPGRRHILLGANLLPYSPPKMLPGDTILYNLEQISEDSAWVPGLLTWLRDFEVWDYSGKNIEKLKEKGIENVKHLPIGYVPQLTRVKPVHEDIDVLFVGSINERRAKVLGDLAQRGVNVHRAYGVYGAERDELYARAKICLNLHYYESKIFEAVRVSYLLANRRFVVSERGLDPSENEFEAGLVFANYEHLVNVCMSFLNRAVERTVISAAGLSVMRRRDECNYLRQCLY